MTRDSTILQEVATRFGGKLSGCEVYDGNVCTTRPVPDRPWELELLAGKPFSERLKLTYPGRKVVVLANRAYVHGSTGGTFESRPFTINSRQKAGFRSELAETLRVNDEQYPVFTEDGRVSPAQKSLFGRPELLSLVVRAGLQGGRAFSSQRAKLVFILSGNSPTVVGLAR